MAAKLEREYQPIVKDKISELLPGCIILKNDPSVNPQGIPDLSIFYKDKWAMIEVKKSKDEPYRPNQPYYLQITDNMSFSRTIFPENEARVLSDLEKFFKGGKEK